MACVVIDFGPRPVARYGRTNAIVLLYPYAELIGRESGDADMGDDVADAKQLLMILTKQVVNSPTSRAWLVVILLKDFIERETEECEGRE